MELLSLLHLPMSVLGSVLFLLGLVLIRLAKQVGQRPEPPRWLRHDMTCLIVGTLLSLPLSFGLGLLIAAGMETVTGRGESPFALLAAIVIMVIGWRLAKRTRPGALPAQA
ncbi:MAG: hypothetical protein R3F54_22810 [Alphaproteobacteria bacterium]